MTATNDEKIFISYRLRCVLITAVAIFFAGLLIYNIQQLKTEHLIGGSADLSKHVISDENAELNPHIIFLGSSPNHNIEDQMKTLMPAKSVYDISIQNGNLVTSLALQYSLNQTKPKIYVMGMDLSDLYLDPIWAAPIEKQMPKLKQSLPPTLVDLLEQKITFKHKLFFKVNLWSHLLSYNLIPARDILKQTQLNFYGEDITQMITVNTLDPYLKSGLQAFVISLWDYAPQIFAELKKSIEKDKGKLVVYLTPVKVSSKDEALHREKLYDQLKQILKDQGITTFDYVDYYQNKPESHLDIIHLTAPASKEIAQQILKDLSISLN